ncbi:MAG: hypothetical protein V7K67_15970 [Nostoc sp.]|uniref:hypothetical protein n=1 Tax=Nostoc sp. TaxID=1180 RepID=UPI002FF8744B
MGRVLIPLPLTGMKTSKSPIQQIAIAGHDHTKFAIAYGGHLRHFSVTTVQ